MIFHRPTSSLLEGKQKCKNTQWLIEIIYNFIISDFILDDIVWNQFFKKFFWKPWPHGPVYFIGLAFGYVVYKIRPKILTNVNSIWRN